MKLRVKYSAQLRAAIGATEEDVELPAESSLSELLVQLAARHCAAKTHLVTAAGQAGPSLLMVVNDVAVAGRDAARTLLHEGDVVMLLPPIAGG